MSMTTGLQLDDLRLTLAGRAFLRLSLQVGPGECVSVMGPSGAGKSTLLAAITGTLDPAFGLRGRVVLNGRDITHARPETRRVGILFQDDLLFPHLSVGGNLGFGLDPGIKGRARRRAAIDAALDAVGLAGFARRDPATLSGGQKMRVALQRTLLSRPQALVLDEPFSGLDPERRAAVRALVFERARAQGLPVLLVTHDDADARAAGGPVVMLGGNGAG